MKKLIEMSEIITQKRAKKIEVINKTVLNNKAHKLSQLYDGIISGKFKTDAVAAEALYNAPPSDSRYATLKNNFKKRLYNNFFYLDVNSPSYSDYKQAFYTCYKNLALCRILAAHSARLSAVELAEKTIKKAEQYLLTEIVIGCAHILKDHSSFIGNLKNHRKYRNIISHQLNLLKCETLAEDYYQDIIIHYSQSVASKNELFLLASKYIEDLKPMAKSCKSLSFQYSFHRIWALMHELKNDYRKALQVIQRFETYLDEYSVFKENDVIAKICTLKLDCNLHLNDFHKGEQAALLALELHDKSKLNRFVFFEFYFLLSIRTKKYTQALKIIIEVLDYPKFDYFPASKKEIWRIYEAYMNFLIDTNKLKADELKGLRIKRFKASDFLKNVPIFTKDKRGYNVAILVIQILFMLIRQEFGGIIDRMDSLKTYRSRHLKREEDHRNKVFIKLLMIMEKQTFDYHSTKEKASKYVIQLSKGHFKYEGSPVDAEIIPYETLWKMVLEILKKQPAS